MRAYLVYGRVVVQSEEAPAVAWIRTKVLNSGPALSNQPFLSSGLMNCCQTCLGGINDLTIGWLPQIRPYKHSNCLHSIP